MPASVNISGPLAPETLGLAREASDLLVRSDIMAVVVVAASVASWLLAGWVQMRAAAPGTSNRLCLISGVDVLVGGSRLSRWGSSVPGRVPAELAAAATGITLALVVLGSALALLYLAVAGHLPAEAPSVLVGVVVLVALGGLCLSVRGVALVPERNRWLAVRGPHLTAAAALGEVVLTAATTATAWVLTHTDGSPISLLEVALASVAARGLTLSRIPRAGIVVADVAFVATLLGVGLSAGASLATVAVWRFGWALTWLVAVVNRPARAHPGVAVRLPSEPTGSLVGEWVHRAAFRLIGDAPMLRQAPVVVFQGGDRGRGRRSGPGSV